MDTNRIQNKSDWWCTEHISLGNTFRHPWTSPVFDTLLLYTATSDCSMADFVSRRSTGTLRLSVSIYRRSMSNHLFILFVLNISVCYMLLELCGWSAWFGHLLSCGQKQLVVYFSVDVN
jgi:hypothetical protein